MTPDFSPKKRKIKNKFFLIFSIVGVIPVLIMGLAALSSVSRTHRVDVSSLELQLIGQKQEEVKKLIDETVGVLQLQVGFEQVGDIAPEHQDFLLESLLSTNNYLTEVSFINIRGKETKKLLRDQENTELIELVNVSKLEKFLQAKEGKDYVGKVYYTQRGPMLSLASPVKNKNGVIIMVLAGEMNLAPIQSIALSTKLGNTGYFYILDEHGKLLAHSMQKRLTPNTNLSKSAFTASLLAGKTRTGLEDEDYFVSVWGDEVVGAGIPMDRPPWALITEWPLEDANIVVKNIHFQLFSIAAGAFLIILFFTIWVARKIARPIQTLKEGAQIIGNGQFDYRIAIKTNDELEDLGETFNRMAVDLATVEALRTEAIRSEALEKSLAKERELSHNKDSFIANASHQLRTPLATISWGLESVLTNAKGEDLKTVQAAYEGTTSLNEILNDLLAVSEYGFGYKEKTMESVDVSLLIQAVASQFQPIFEKKKIMFSLKNELDKVNVRANAIVLKKALSYVFDNAAIYANTTFTVTVEADDKQIIIALSDDGIGIPKEDTALIFNQFFRAKNAIAKKNVGTGLGLFLARNMIEAFEGKIWFESQENRGTTFFVALQKTSTPNLSFPATTQ